MEKVFFRNSTGLRLAGVFHNPPTDRRSVIIMSHGFTGDKDEWGMFPQTAAEFSDAGFAVFRFDFGGSGESDITSITVEKQTNDLKSAIDFVKEKGFDNIGLFGLSMGGLCSVLACGGDIKALVLWAPVTKAKTPTVLKNGDLMSELKEKGYIVIRNRVGKEFRIDEKYLTERQSLNQKEILSRLNIPVLIIHGDRDDIVPVTHSKEAMAYLKKGSKLEIIEGADHGFNGFVPEVTDISRNWFIKEMLKELQIHTL